MARVTLKSRLPAIAAELRPRVSAAVKATAEAIAVDARARVELGPPPVHVKENIEVIRHEAAGYLVAVTATDPSGVSYPFVLEFGGTRKDGTSIPAYPFLLPATEAHEDTAEQLVAAALRGL